FAGWRRMKQELDARIAAARGTPLPHWTLHDLRRTTATRMREDIGVPPHIVELILGHGEADPYDHAECLNDRLTALSAWADLVEPLAAGTPVEEARWAARSAWARYTAATARPVFKVVELRPAA